MRLHLYNCSISKFKKEKKKKKKDQKECGAREKVNWPNLISGISLYSPARRVRAKEARERAAPFSNPKVSFHGQFTCLNTNHYIDCCVGAGGEIWCRLGKCIFGRENSLSPAAAATSAVHIIQLSLLFIFFSISSRARWSNPFFFSFFHAGTVGRSPIVVLYYWRRRGSNVSFLACLFSIHFYFHPSVF